VLGHRCDGLAACSDLADERNCYELTGRDQLSCGGEVWFPQQFCRDSDCGSGVKPPLCDPARPDRFLCAGGSDVESSLVCDRNPDCADGSDEAHCLR